MSLKVRPDEVMFSASVRAEQARRGSRSAYGRRAERGGFAAELPPEAAAFIAERNSAYLATASADGQPYVQHRGGPGGFVHALDARTLAFAHFAGNRQYISIGNLAENERAFLFFMDYAAGRRLKLWGRASVIDAEPGLIARLSLPGYPARVEHAILFRVEAWDWNCPQHIPRLVPAG